MAKPKIIIIGAGIMGAAIAHALAEAGFTPMLFERGAKPATGVTAHAFGWVNLINGMPEDAWAYGLRSRAVALYHDLATQMPSAFAHCRHGSLLWDVSAAKTVELAKAHHQAGVDIRLIDKAAIAKREPLLRHAPEVAIYAPKDMAINAADLAAHLLEDARGKGAVITYHQEIGALVARNDRIAGVQAGGEFYAADYVVVAAGGASAELLASVGISVDIDISPVALITLAGDGPILRHIVRSPELEIRQTRCNSLLVPASFDSKAGDLAACVERKIAAISAHFGTNDQRRVMDMAIGNRPMPRAGQMLAGASRSLRGLYCAVAHPGVILAPLIGQYIAGSLRGDEVVTLHKEGGGAFL